MIYILFSWRATISQETLGINRILLSTILISFVSSYPFSLAQFNTIKIRVDVFANEFCI